MQPTGSDLHVDSILTNFSEAYRNSNEFFIATRAASALPVAKESDIYYIYDKGPYFRDDMRRRAPGQQFARTGWTLTTGHYTTYEWGLEIPMADEDRANADNPLDIERDSVELLQGSNLIRMERAFASLAFASSAWTSSDATATDWDGSSGVPITAVQRAQRTVQGLTGLKPNTMACGLIVDHALQTNDEITGKLQYTQRVLPQDLQALMAFALGLSEYHVSQATYDSTAEATSDSPTMTAIIDDDAIVYYKPATPGLKRPTAILLPYWNPGGGLGMLERYREEKIKSDIARIQSQWDMKKVSADLGYRFGDIA